MADKLLSERIDEVVDAICRIIDAKIYAASNPENYWNDQSYQLEQDLRTELKALMEPSNG